MFKYNKEKMFLSDIEKNIGMLPAKIVYNDIVKNDYNLWFISNYNGDKLLFNPPNREMIGGVLAWTDCSLAESYLNRKNTIHEVLMKFGKIVILVKLNLFHLQTLLDETNYQVLSNLLVNKNQNGFFVPVNLSNFRNYTIDLYKKKSDEFIKIAGREYGNEIERYFFVFNIDSMTFEKNNEMQFEDEI